MDLDTNVPIKLTALTDGREVLIRIFANCSEPRLELWHRGMDNKKFPLSAEAAKGIHAAVNSWSDSDN